ncbi:hypothetical protein [Methylobacterium radiotolerans]|uniref:Uncharacterized protein n=1 Tax=Methylobacterium radiotolerans (strain ATCC 27329 / DSM 1819 / JCM 2831 / NBRC 15690 / NCIMB 10815 / 0-1) TaxID=426355 RepID=B1M9Q0_METRJ|nr:hypothetical protein [Methylobacterium radiotolerans]ACB28225.1 hypothetical protein Mrad2831_6303 [Methylobacterium radiotolerans JCM 2831]GEN01774.1 hypothetical protein MRA01_63130 [Methylobacterium radiotolerans]
MTSIADYTPEQIGEIRVHPLNTRTKGQYSLVIVQPKSNEQILVLEPCDWDHGRNRVVQMVAAGVDPFDIRFTFRKREQLETDGLPLRPCSEALWWTSRDEERRQASLADLADVGGAE